MTISEAEGTVSAARMAGPEAAQDRAWHRHDAAKGLLTSARKDGSADHEPLGPVSYPKILYPGVRRRLRSAG